MQEWYREKREAVEQVFVDANAQIDKTEKFESPSGRYSLETIPYATGPKSWGYSKGVVRHNDSSDVIAEVKRNFGHFPFAWVEDHTVGHDYLITGEDYQGQTIIELDTDRRIDFMPDSAESGWGFCWAKHYPSPDRRFLFVDGCFWGAPYELVLFDFSDPMALPYEEINRWPVWEVDGFLEDGSFTWRYEAEIRKSDGKRVDEMSEKEAEEFEESGDYSDQLGEETVHMKWHPNGDVGEVAK